MDNFLNLLILDFFSLAVHQKCRPNTSYPSQYGWFLGSFQLFWRWPYI